MPAAQRGAVQVDRRAEDDVDALATRLHCSCRTVPPGNVPIPRRRQRSGRREGSATGRARPRPRRAPRRTVGDEHAAQADLLDRPGGPEVPSGQELHLLLEGQRVERLVRSVSFFDIGTSLLRGRFRQARERPGHQAGQGTRVIVSLVRTSRSNAGAAAVAASQLQLCRTCRREPVVWPWPR